MSNKSGTKGEEGTNMSRRRYEEHPGRDSRKVGALPLFNSFYRLYRQTLIIEGIFKNSKFRAQEILKS
jgi:hypothetical protein